MQIERATNLLRRVGTLALAPAVLLLLGGRTHRPAWTELAPGLEAASIAGATGIDAAVLRVDLSKARLRVVDIREPQTQAHRTVQDLVGTGSVLAAVNGGFFDVDGKPLGLIISDGVQRQGLRNVDWGVFYVSEGRARIVHTAEWPYKSAATAGTPLPLPEQGLQCGPRLVVDGKALKLKPQVSRRSAIGIDAKGRVLLLTTASSVEAADLAAMMLDLGAQQALNLDGGPSAQMAIRSPRLNLDIEGGTPVPTAIVVEGTGLAPETSPRASDDGVGCH